MTDTDKTGIRNAATVIVLRDRDTAPRILMGQRGAKAVFMPNKFVFPGGAVDAVDGDVPLARPINDLCYRRLGQDRNPGVSSVTPNALAAAAVRELFEETGQILAQPGDWERPANGTWKRFADRGLVPDAAALQFVFRALTPPGRPRRFDARFFLVDADCLVTDPDDFCGAEDELSHLQWVPLADARHFDMPFITEVVLAEIQANLERAEPPESVPYFKNNEEANLFLRIYGHAQTDR